MQFLKFCEQTNLTRKVSIQHDLERDYAALHDILSCGYNVNQIYVFMPKKESIISSFLVQVTVYCSRSLY